MPLHIYPLSDHVEQPSSYPQECQEFIPQPILVMKNQQHALFSHTQQSPSTLYSFPQAHLTIQEIPWQKQR